mmetsp:Transcript_17728/g.58251  ORF Transcript_17728/g.58251 Transcript_17728/m.58251 type:complete len:250 (+) Transcript_17728:1481-2230(+)
MASCRPLCGRASPQRRAWPPRTPSSRSRSMNGCTSRRRRQSGRSCHHSGAFVAVGGSRAARSGLGHCGTLPPFWWVRASALPPSVAGSAAPSPWARSTRGCRRACRACRRGCRVSAASSPSATSSWGRCCSVTMAQGTPPLPPTRSRPSPLPRRRSPRKRLRVRSSSRSRWTPTRRLCRRSSRGSTRYSGISTRSITRCCSSILCARWRLKRVSQPSSRLSTPLCLATRPPSGANSRSIRRGSSCCTRL